MTPDVVRVFVGDVVVIKDVSGSYLWRRKSAGGTASDRVLISHRPSNLVDTVHGLLDKSSAAQPGVVVPVSDLPFDVGHAIGPE